MKHPRSLIPAQYHEQSEHLRRIQMSFQHYLGQTASLHCTVAKANRDILVFVCDSSSWANRMRFQQRELVKLLRSEFGIDPKKVITKVGTLRPMPSSRPSTRLTPPSPDSVNTIRQSAKSIKDNELSEQLAQLADYFDPNKA